MLCDDGHLRSPTEIEFCIDPQAEPDELDIELFDNSKLVLNAIMIVNSNSFK